MTIIFFYFLHQPFGIPNKLLTVSTARNVPGRGLKKHEICTAAFDGHLLSGVGGHVAHCPLFPTAPRASRLDIGRGCVRVMTDERSLPSYLSRHLAQEPVYRDKHIHSKK